MTGRIAQLVEQRTENPCVGGSNPSSTTTYTLKLLVIRGAFFMGSTLGSTSDDKTTIF